MKQQLLAILTAVAVLSTVLSGCSVSEQPPVVLPDASPIESPSLSTPPAEDLAVSYDETCFPSASSPLMLSEVRVTSYDLAYRVTEEDSYYDWVELVNVSDQTVDLGDFFLSDNPDNLQKFALPEKQLEPGEYYVFKDMSLDCVSEDVFLTGPEGVCDYLHIEGVPYYGSYGRLIDRDGSFYFTSPTEGKENRNGKPRRSSVPECDTNGGVYDGIRSLTVTLSADGPVYYTLDGNLPNADDILYSGPITLTGTTVLRAVSIEEDAAPSDPLTLSFIINEGHSLPVISYTCDDYDLWNSMYHSNRKDFELPGNMEFYASDGSFNAPCGASMSGNASLLVSQKKGMNIYFRDAYGCSGISCDVFNNGQTEYSSFNLRSGTDGENRFFNTEMWQDLCMEMSKSVLTQNSRFTVVYVNGHYQGVYPLKDNIRKAWYASVAGVSKNSVEEFTYSNRNTSDFKTYLYEFCISHDLSLEENYHIVTDCMDIDSFIDWLILEGVCANRDLNKNVRAFRSDELDGRWRFVYYDLDYALTQPYMVWCLANPQHGSESDMETIVLGIFNALIQSDTFLDAFLSRYAEVYDSVLSNDNILRTVDRYTSLLREEIPRDKERWNVFYGLSIDWEKESVQEIRDIVNQYDWQNYAVSELCKDLELSAEMQEKYFGSVRYIPEINNAVTR